MTAREISFHPAALDEAEAARVGMANGVCALQAGSSMKSIR